MPTSIVQPKGWKAPKGYSNGVVGTGRMLFVAGQVGWDAQEQLAAGFAAQFAQALDNVLAVVREAGGQPADVARLTVYVVDRREYLAAAKALGAAWRERFGKHYPAMALVEVKGLVEDGARVEIEATAVLSPVEG